MKAKVITTLLLCMMGTFCMPVIARTDVQGDCHEKDNRTINYWYVEGAAGVQTIFSSDACMLDFGKRLTPAYSLTFGKWVNPYIGFRLQTQGYALNGFSTPDGLYLGNPLSNGGIYGPKDPVMDEVNVNPDGTYRHYLRYVAAHVDIQFSLLNIIAGVNADRRWDVLPAIGLGYAHAFAYRGTVHTHSMINNFSLMGKFRIINCLDLNMEVQSALMPDHFDSRITGRMCEPTLGLTMGLTYRFRTKSTPTPAVVYVPNEVIRVEHDTLVMTRDVERIVEKSPIGDVFTIGSVHFKIGKVLPIEGQEPQFVNVVKFLKENPKARIRLDGYADKETGTDEVNMELSVSRSTAIRSILINDYGVDAKRIEAQALGANAQPYDVNDHNRVVLIQAIVE